VRWGIALAAAGLTACGGGDGSTANGAGEPLQVTFGQASLSAITFDDLGGRSASIGVTLSPIPTGTIYLFPQDDPAFFDLAGLQVADQGGGHYLVTLPYANGKPAGSYAGTLHFRMCRDLGCAQPFALSTSSLPYAVTIQHRASGPPAVAFTYTPTAVTSWDNDTFQGASLGFTVTPAPASGPFVRFQQSGSFFKPGGFFTTGNALPPSFTSGSTYWVFLPYPDLQAAGVYTGTLALEICADAACTQPLSLPYGTFGYRVTVLHVQAGLPPLTCTLEVGGVTAGSVNEGLDSAGQRTYALAVKDGQVVAVLCGTNVRQVSYSAGTTSAVLTYVTFSPPTYRVSLPPSATSATNQLMLRVDDGRKVTVGLTVTP
jgi:hypothetical protein